MNVTSKQKEMLLTLLKKDPEIVRGRIDRKSESRRKMVNWKNNIIYRFSKNNIIIIEFLDWNLE